MCEDGLNLNIMDELVPVTGDESVQCSLKLAATNGIFTGISGGGSIAAALKGALAPYAAPVACARACLLLTLALTRTNSDRPLRARAHAQSLRRPRRALSS